jgi:hypothetical protein
VAFGRRDEDALRHDSAYGAGRAPVRLRATRQAPALTSPASTCPDHRGRTGLDRVGRDLDGNPRVRVVDVELLAAGWHVLRRTTLDYRRADGSWSRQQRETYDRGNGATVLLYNRDLHTVLLTGSSATRSTSTTTPTDAHRDRRGAARTTTTRRPRSGARPRRRPASRSASCEHVYDVFMSPGSVTERIHFFAAPYDVPLATRAGGGSPRGRADRRARGRLRRVARDDPRRRIQDAKTIMLLQWAAIDGPFAGDDARRRKS